LIEVLVTAVILFAGLGAVLKAYSAAALALDSAEDALAVRQVMGELFSRVELQAADRKAPAADGGGDMRVDGRAYRWELRGRQWAMSPEVAVWETTLRARRERGGVERVLAGEWVLIRKPEPAGAVR
jgi:hypothetical protein